jgi:hypothetical protein
MSLAPDGAVLLSVMRDPRQALTLGVADWNALLECARRHALIARLSVILRDSGCFEALPQIAQEVLDDARLTADSNHTLLRYEANRVVHALRDIDVPVVLLKGGAYIMAGLPPARGRVSGDLDILVPRARIGEVEQAMIAHGWVSLVSDSYDEHYYREWSHQIPPLRHGERDSELDVHHTIAPPTGPARPDAEAIFAAAQSIPNPRRGEARLRVLCPADMVLHSAVHLFNEQMTMALRDLSDMHDLLNHYGHEPGFWTQLVERAVLHRVERPLFYCARYCQRFLGTQVPAMTSEAIAVFAPGSLALAIMDRLVEAALIHAPQDRPDRGADFARWLLFVRAHRRRMPLRMLVRHLAVKAFRRSRESPQREEIAQA